LVVDEIIVRFEGRLKEITTVPNKPIPIGYKVWGAAQRGFLLVWNWHIPGQKKMGLWEYVLHESLVGRLGLEIGEIRYK
jgi:hypothetical protein